MVCGWIGRNLDVFKVLVLLSVLLFSVSTVSAFTDADIFKKVVKNEPCLVDCKTYVLIHNPSTKNITNFDVKGYIENNYGKRLANNITILANQTVYRLETKENQTCWDSCLYYGKFPVNETNTTTTLMINDTCYQPCARYNVSVPYYDYVKNWTIHPNEDLMFLITGHKNATQNVDFKLNASLYGQSFLSDNWAWWNNTWKNKAQVNFTTTSGTAPTGIEMNISITNTNFPNFVWNYNCTDIRVLNSSENGNVPFFVESCNSAAKTANIWIKSPKALSATPTVVYLYYNARGVSSISSGVKTFEVYDDFNGASLNQSYWTLGYSACPATWPSLISGNLDATGINCAGGNYWYGNLWITHANAGLTSVKYKAKMYDRGWQSGENNGALYLAYYWPSTTWGMGNVLSSSIGTEGNYFIPGTWTHGRDGRSGGSEFWTGGTQSTWYTVGMNWSPYTYGTALSPVGTSYTPGQPTGQSGAFNLRMQFSERVGGYQNNQCDWVRMWIDGYNTTYAIKQQSTPLTVTMTTPTRANLSKYNVSLYTFNVTINGKSQSMINISFNGSKGSFKGVLLNSSLVLAESFDNNTIIGDNKTLAVDSSLARKNGTINGATYASGRYLNGLSFGKSNYVKFDNSSSLILGRNGKGFSFEFWVNFNNVKMPTYQTIAARDVASASYRNFFLALNQSDNHLYFSFHNASDSSFWGYSKFNFTAGKWYHVVLVYDRVANALRTYVNGSKYGWTLSSSFPSTLGNLAYNKGNFTIGYEPYLSQYPLNGTLDEFHVWTRTLTAQEVNMSFYSNLRKYNNSLTYEAIRAPVYPSRYNYIAYAASSTGFSDSSRMYYIDVYNVKPALSFASSTFVGSYNTSTSRFVNVSVYSPFNITSGVIYLYNDSNVLLHQINYTVSPVRLNYNMTYTFTGLADGIYKINATANNSLNLKNASIPKFTTVDKVVPVNSFLAPTAARLNVSSQIFNISIAERNLRNLTFAVRNNTKKINVSYYDDNLVLDVNFNNNANLGDSATVAVDTSQKDNNGTIFKASYTTGKWGNALLFNGRNQSVKFGNASSLLLGRSGNSFSLEAWINPSQLTPSKYGMIMGRYAPYGIFFGQNTSSPGALLVVVYNSSGSVYQAFTSANTLTVGTWQYVAFVYNRGSNTASIYINGVSQTLKSSTFPVTLTNTYNSKGNFSVGDFDIASTYPFNGSIDEPRVWSRALSATEISEHYLGNLYKFNKTQWYLRRLQTVPNSAYTYQSKSGDLANSVNTTSYYTRMDASGPAITFNPSSTPSGYNTSKNIFINVSSADANNVTFMRIVFYNDSGYVFNTYNVIGNQYDTVINFTHTFSSLVNGTYRFNVTANDTFNNMGTLRRFITIRTIGPVGTVLAPTYGNKTVALQTFNYSLSERYLRNLTLTYKNNTKQINISMYNDNLQMMYDFDNLAALGESTSKVVDLSNAKYNLTINPNRDAAVTGKYGSALNFTARSGANASNVILGREVTYDLWFRIRQTGIIQYLAGGCDDPDSSCTGGNYNQTSIALGTGNNLTVCLSPNSNHRYVCLTTTSTFTTGTWYHIVSAINLTSNTGYIYVNGVKQTVKSTSASIVAAYSFPLSKFTIGGWYDKYSNTVFNRLNGTIDNFKMFNKTMPTSYINISYRSNLQKYNKTQWYMRYTETFPDSTYTLGLKSGNLEKLTNTTSQFIRVDTRVPVVTFVGKTTSTATVNKQTWIYANVSQTDANGNRNITITLYNKVGTLMSKQFGLNKTTYVYNFTGLADGSYNINSTANDGLGNKGGSATRNIVLDNAIGVSFITPTPKNGTWNTTQYINTSIAEQNLSTINMSYSLVGGSKYNVTFFDSTLKLHASLDSNTNIGETGTRVMDDSKFYRRGTMVGTPNSKPGRYGNAMNFTWHTNYINFTTSTDFNLGPKFTAEAWIAPSDVADGWKPIMGTYGGTTGWIFAINSSSNNALNFYQGNAWYPCKDSRCYMTENNQWRHVAVVISGTQIRYYVNGVNVYNVTAAAFTGTAGEMQIGNGGTGWAIASYGFAGRIDNVEIYNRTLSSDEMKWEYYSNFDRFNKTQWYLQSKLWKDGNQTTIITANDAVYNVGSSSRQVVQNGFVPFIAFVVPTASTGSYARTSIRANVTSSSSLFKNIRIYLYNKTMLYSSKLINVTPAYYNFTGLADGRYYLNATSNDTLGKKNSTSTLSYVLDVSNPILGFITPSNNSYLTASTATFNISSNENLSSCNMTVSGVGVGTWAYGGWNYRKMINLSSTVTVNNHPYLLSFSTFGLAKSKLKADCSDLRFADSNGNPLTYMYSSGCNTTSTYVYVKVNLTSGTIPIYVYYGNSGASSTSSSATFPSGVIRYYPMNGIANDLVGGYSLSVAGGTPVASIGRRGWSSESYYYGGSAWHTAVATSLPTGASARTTCFWISYTGANDTNFHAAVGWGPSTGAANTDWSMGRASTGDSQPSKYAVSIYGASIHSAIESKTWKLDCFTYNGARVVGWENGTYFENASASLSTTSSVLGVGMGAPYAPNKMVGYLEEVSVYNTALNSAQLNSLYAKTEPAVASTGSEVASNSGVYSMTVSNKDTITSAYKILTLIDGTNNYYYTCKNPVGLSSVTKTNVYIADLTNPVVSYNYPTLVNNSFYNRTYLRLNVSIVDTNFLNATTNIYTGGSLFSKRASLAASYSANFTGLSNNGVYVVNTTAFDASGRKGYQKSRIYIIDIINPQIQFVNSTRASMTDGLSTIINISFNDTNTNDVNFTWKNATKSKNVSFAYNNLIAALNFDNRTTGNNLPYYSGLTTAGFWHMNEASGTLTDSSGNGATCTGSGSNITYSNAGVFGTSVRLSQGGSDYFGCTTPTSLILKRTGTVSIWAKNMGTTASNPNLIGYAGSTRWWWEYGYQISVGTGGVYMLIDNETASGDGKYDSCGGLTLPSSGVWHHYLMTWDGTRLTCYIDGQVAGNVSQHINSHPTGGSFVIGRSTHYSTYFDGLVDEAFVSATPMSPSQVRALVRGSKYYDSSSFNNNYTGYLIMGNTTAVTGVHNTGFKGSSIYPAYVSGAWNTRMVSSSGTVCMWMKRGTATSPPTGYLWSVLSKDGYYMYGYDDGSRISIYQGTTVTNNVFTGTNKITDTKWHYLCWSSTGSVYKIYIDGVSQTLNVTSGSNNGAWTASLASYQVPLTINPIGWTGYNGNGALMFGNRTVDDILWFNKSLSDDDVAGLYNSTLNKYSNTRTLTFYKNNLKTATNYTYSSLIVDNAGNMNYTDTRWLVASSPVYVTLKKKSPADLDSLDLFGQYKNVTITYNMTSAAGLVKTTAQLEYKTNNSKYDGTLIINGTRTTGFTTSNINVKNVSSNFTFTATERNVYPAEYPIDPGLYYANIPSYKNFTTLSSGYKVKFRFMRNDTLYNMFEFMARNWTNTGLLHVIYCNKSYLSGQNWTTSTNCVQAGSIAAVDVINHTHNQYNKHYLISIVINVTSGKIRTVAVTNTSYFIFEPESGNWSMSTLPWMSQINTNQYSTNQGLNWVNNSYTINTHLHQYSGSEKFWYRGCIKNVDGARNCSTYGQDLLDLKGLAPTGFAFLSPISQTRQSRIVNISHTDAQSPNGYAMANYTYYLLYTNFTQKALIYYNGLNRQYIWNASSYNGTFLVKVRACDSQNQCVLQYSEQFPLYNNSKPPIVKTVGFVNGTTIGGVPIALTCNASDEFNLRVIGIKIFNGSNVMFRSNRTLSTSLYTSQTWNYNFTKSKAYNWSCFAADGRWIGNSSLYKIRADLTPPGMSLISPTPSNASYTNKTHVFVNASVTENVSSCSLTTNISGYTLISDVWADSTFKYRKLLNVSNAYGSALSDYQTSLIIDTTQLISSGKMQSTCADIRVADRNGGLQDIWVRGCNAVNTTISFKATSLPTGYTRFYIYYGNSTTVSLSDYKKMPRLLNHDFEQGYNNWTKVSGDCFRVVTPGAFNCCGGSCSAFSGQQGGYGANLGGDQQVSTVNSSQFTLMAGVAAIKYLRAGGNDAPGGVSVIRSSDGAVLCADNNGTKTDTFFVTYCHGIAAYAGTKVYIKAYDSSPGYFQKVYIDNFDQVDASNNIIDYVSTEPIVTVGSELDKAIIPMTFVNNNANTYAYADMIYKEGSVAYTVTCADVFSNSNTTKSYRVTADRTAPNVTFLNSIPNDLDIFNAVGHGLNLTYNVTDNYNINKNSLRTYIKTNSSVSDCTYSINGTKICGYISNDYQNYTTTGSKYRFNYDDNEVYPAVYNAREEDTENDIHKVFNLTKAADYAKIEFLNISNIKRYGFYEIMLKSLSGTGAASIYACNSSLVSNSVPNTNCGLLSTLTTSTPYNHTESAYSKHMVFILPINATSGTMVGVKITPKMYFIVKGAGGTVWQIYVVSNKSRTASAFGMSTNNGNAYTYYARTPDSHVHEYYGTERNYRRLFVCDNAGNCVNSTVLYDPIALKGLPPTPPDVIRPANVTYVGQPVPINYTRAYSYENYSIVNYSISLLNSNYKFNRTIIRNNGLRLNYTLNMLPIGAGSFVINVTACDIYNQCTSGYSDVFSNVNDILPPSVQFVYPTVQQGGWNKNYLYFNVSGIDNIQLQNISVMLYNSSGTRIHIDTKTIPSSVSGSLFMNYTGILSGTYKYNATAFDKVGNKNKTRTYNVTVDVVPPIAQHVSPINYTITNITSRTFICNASDNMHVANLSISVWNTYGNKVAYKVVYPLNTTYNVTSMSYNFTQAGKYIWECKAGDLYITSSSKNYTIYYYNGNPSISFISPTTASGYNSNSWISISTDAFDPLLDTVKIRLYNGSNVLMNTTTGHSEYLYVNLTGLADGTYRFNATVNNTVGKVAATGTNFVILDTVNPQIHFTAGADDNGTVTRRYINANITVYDKNLQRAYVRLYNSSGAIVANSTIYTTANVRFTNLYQGTYYMNASAFDNAGRRNFTNTRIVTVHLVGPDYRFIVPTLPDQSYSRYTSILANLTVYDSIVTNSTLWLWNTTELITTYYCGSSIPCYHNFSSLGNGVYYLNATGYDNLNQKGSSITQEIRLSTIPPKVYINYPIAGNYTNSNVSFNITIMGSAVDRFNMSWNNKTKVLNYTFLGDGLIWAAGLDHNTAIGDTLTEVRDYSIYSKNGTITGANYSNGKYSKGLYFNVPGRKVKVNDVPVNIAAGGKNTVEFWFFRNSHTGACQVSCDVYFDTVPFAFNNMYALDWHSEHCFGFYSGVSSILGFDPSGLSGGWHHVSAVFYNGVANNSNSKIYIDGVQRSLSLCDGGQLQASKSASGTLWLGNIGDNANLPWDGVIDEVRVWNKELSATQVMQDYHSNIRMYNETKFTFVSSQIIPDGNYTFRGYAASRYGLNNYSTVRLDIDTTKPTSSFVAPTTSDGYRSTMWISANITASDRSGIANATMKLYKDGGLFASSPSGSVPRFYNFTNLQSGSYKINYTVYDTFGWKSVSSYRLITLDNTTPRTSFIYPPTSGDTYGYMHPINMTIDERNLNYTNYTLYNGTSAKNYTIYNGSLIFMSSLDGNSAIGESGNVVVDTSKSRHNGTLYGSYVSGRHGNAISGYVNVYNLNVNKISGKNNTVDFWTYYGSNGWKFMFSSGYGIKQLGDCFGFSTGAGITGVSGLNTTYANKWVHVLVVMPNGLPSSNSRILINGKQYSLSNCYGLAPLSTSASGNITIGGSGYTDEFKLFNIGLPLSDALHENVTVFTKMNTTRWNLAIWDYPITGEYTSIISAKDLVGFNNKSTVYYSVFKYPVTVSFVNPTTNSGNTTNSWLVANISATSSDPIGVIKLYVYNASNSLYNRTTIYGSNNLFVNMTNMPNGLYRFNVTANDTLGNRGNDSRRVVDVDLDGIIIRRITPLTNNSYVRANNIDLRIGLGDDPSSCTVNWNGTVYSMSLYKHGNKSNATYYIGSLVDNKTYTYDYQCTDYVGRTNTTKNYTLYVRYLKPIITVYSPINNSKHISSSILINYSVVNYRNTWWGYTYWVTVGKHSYPHIHNQTYTQPVYWSAPDGTQIIYFYANDSINNNASKMFTFGVDTVHPTLTYVSPSPSDNVVSITNSTYINVSGSENLNKCNLMLNDSVIPMTSKSQCTTGYPPTCTPYGQVGTSLTFDKLYIYHVWCNDTYGNGANSTNRTIIASSAMKLAYVGKTDADGLSSSKNYLQVNSSFSTQDLLNATLYVYQNGILYNKTVRTSDGYLGFNFTDLPQGVYVFNMTAYNAHRNRAILSSHTIGLYNDSVPPVVHMVSPAAGFSTVSAVQNFICNITDDKAVYNVTFYLYNKHNQVLYHNVSYVTGKINVSNVSMNLPYEMGYNWTCEGSDVFNRVWAPEGLHLIYRDSNPPSLIYLSGTTGSYSKTRIISISVNASDLTLNRVVARVFNASGDIINISNSPGYPYGGVFNFNIPVSSDGIYYFNVSANDSLNRVSKLYTIQTTIDTVVPYINWTGGTTINGTYTRTWIFANMTASDINKDHDTIWLLRNGVEYTHYTTYGSFKNFTNLPSGNYILFGTSYDKAGNKINTTIRAITLDAQSPNFYFVAPTPDSGTNASASSIVVNMTTNDPYQTYNLTLWKMGTGIVRSHYGTTLPVYDNFTGLVDGVYVFNLTANNSLGNRVTSLSGNKTLDTWTSLGFVSPTPPSGNDVNPNLTVSAAIIDTKVKEMDISWFDGIKHYNTTMYDDNLIQMISFNSEINDHSLYNHSISKHDYYVGKPIWGTVYTNYVSGKYGNGIELTTMDKIVHFGNITPSRMSFTEAFWMKRGNDMPQTISMNCPLVITNYENSRLRVHVQNMQDYGMTVNTPTAGNWYYVAITFNAVNNETKVFINGNLSGYTAAWDPNYPMVWSKDCQFSGGVNYWETPMQGAMDEWRFWNRSLSPSDVAQLYRTNLVYDGYDNVKWNNRSTWHITRTQYSLTPANYTYSMYDVDGNGNINSTGIRWYNILDNVPPVLSYLAPMYLERSYSRTSIIANVSSFDGHLKNITVFVFNSSGLVSKHNAVESPDFVNFSGLANGNYIINASSWDSYNNKGYLVSRHITLDTIVPTIVFVYPTIINGTNSSSFAVNVTSGDVNRNKIEIKVYNQYGLSRIINSSSMASVLYHNFTGLGNGWYYINASANDTAGNVGYTQTLSVFMFSGFIERATLNYTMPQFGCKINNGCMTPDCVACTEPSFNTSKYIQYNVSANGQNITMPFYNITNNGTVAINVTLQLNQTTYPGVKFKISTTRSGGIEHVCSQTYTPSVGCMYIVDTSIHVLATNVTPGSYIQGWLYTDFVGVPGGVGSRRNMTIEAVKFRQ